MRHFFQKIPKLPLSALLFYISVIILSRYGLVPHPSGILTFLEGLYNAYGLIGLFISSFLEGIVYFGLYFPGSFIVALAVIVSDGSIESLFTISIVVATALTLTSLINYTLGRSIFSSKTKKELWVKQKGAFSTDLLASMIHPNTLAFYFFNAGIKKQNLVKILFVPLIMIPYGFALGCIFYPLRDPVKTAIESPYVVISLLLLWLIFAYIIDHRNKKKEEFFLP